MNRVRIFAYSDGSCSFKTGKGGLGAYIIDHTGKEYFFKKGYMGTTISRMELKAFILVVENMNPNIPIELNIYSDSEYVIKTFTENRLEKWNRLAWVGTKNLDLWFHLIDELEKRPMLILKPKHIRGHQKDVSDEHIFGNNIADVLADLHGHKEFELDFVKKVKSEKREYLPKCYY